MEILNFARIDIIMITNPKTENLSSIPFMNRSRAWRKMPVPVIKITPIINRRKIISIFSCPYKWSSSAGFWAIVAPRKANIPINRSISESNPSANNDMLEINNPEMIFKRPSKVLITRATNVAVLTFFRNCLMLFCSEIPNSMLKGNLLKGSFHSTRLFKRSYWTFFQPIFWNVGN